MNMDTIDAGPLRVRVLGGTDRRGGGDGPAILLCHGFGAPGDDLVGLARGVDVGAQTRWFFPEAPLEVELGFGMKGRAWWPIDIMRYQVLAGRGDLRTLMHETPEGLPRARAALEECIAQLTTKYSLNHDRLILGGFSQGAMLTTELSIHAQTSYAGLVIFSGTVISMDRWRAALAQVRTPMHVMMTHGRRDALLPFAGAELLKEMFEAAGANVRWTAHQGGHEIPAVSLQSFVQFTHERFGG